jgi:hypothetical protein
MNDFPQKVGLACKEWASVCAALDGNRQHLLLRKGGISESSGEFEVRRGWFYLYPTFVHQQQVSLGEPTWLEKGQRYRAEPGKVKLFHLVRLEKSWEIQDEKLLEKLEPFHVMTLESLRARFHYRKPGLHALFPRVYALNEPLEVPETEKYQGCKSWVDLDEPLEHGVFSPVLSDDDFFGLMERLRKTLEG